MTETMLRALRVIQGQPGICASFFGSKMGWGRTPQGQGRCGGSYFNRYIAPAGLAVERSTPEGWPAGYHLTSKGRAALAGQEVPQP